MIEIKTDNLVIGSGPGGSLASYYLTKNKFKTILIEEGPNTSSKPGLIDNNIETISSNLKKQWRNGGAQFALGPNPISFSEACCLGGGSEINSGIYQEMDLTFAKKWQDKFQIDDFSSEKFKNYYSEIKKLINLEYETNNSGFPTELIKKISKKQKWSYKELPRISNQNPLYPNDSQKLLRDSMSTNLINKSLKNNLKVLTGIKITRLEINKNEIISAYGISNQSGNKIKYRFFAKNYFISCGAVQTPYLLKKSGIKKNIGKFFRLHPTLRLIVKFPYEINANQLPLPLYAITEFLPKIRLSGANNSLPILSTLIAEDWNNRNYLLKDWKKIIILYVMINPYGYGKIYNIPFLNHPIIRYKLLPEDYENLSFGLKEFSKSLIEIGANEIIPCIKDFKSIKNIDELNKFPKELSKLDLNLMSIHLFGSCIPGKNKEYCATDSYGKINGLNNAIICDASQIPESIGVNPQATVMAMSLRNIKNFLNQK